MTVFELERLRRQQNQRHLASAEEAGSGRKGGGGGARRAAAARVADGGKPDRRRKARALAKRTSAGNPFAQDYLRGTPADERLKEPRMDTRPMPNKCVVGFTWPPGHDAAACAVVDGKLVVAIEEERLTRNKHSKREAPKESLKSVLRFVRETYEVRPEDITFAIDRSADLCDVEEDGGVVLERTPALGAGAREAARNLRGDRIDASVSRPEAADVQRLGPFIRDILQADGTKPAPRIVPIEHHLAHAASAYFFSGYSDCVVGVADAGSEGVATSIWQVDRGDFKCLRTVPTLTGSIGLFAERASNLLGLGNLEGPGKLMGLAAYSSSKEVTSKEMKARFDVVDYENEPYSFKLGGAPSSWTELAREYEDLAESRVLESGLNIEWLDRDIIPKDVRKYAYMVQNTIEGCLEGVAKYARDLTGSERFAAAGGVFLNAKANMQIRERLFQEMFVFPAAYNAGAAAGAAAYVYSRESGTNANLRIEKISTVSLGGPHAVQPERLDSHSDWVISESSEDSSIARVAELLVEGKIVAWYSGRSEFGPRALGHRSIVADPTRKEMWEKMNRLKKREWWRPFAPSLLDEEKGKILLRPQTNEFMVTMFEYKGDVCKKLPAVCHVDRTCRPQMVRGGEEEQWLKLIKAFRAKSKLGIGIILNTSFNGPGEPIVESPEEAIRDAHKLGCDALYLNGSLLCRSA